MQQNVEPSAIFFYEFSSVISSFPVAVANASKHQLLQVCRWFRVFTELTWNISIRSKASWAKFFLMLLAYRKQIIQNQRKIVRRAITINVCWPKSSCELSPLANTNAKVANSGEKVVARSMLYQPNPETTQMLTRDLLMVIYKKSYATSRGRMAFKTKCPNCRHNFGRTRPVSRF